ncbi:MAG TPA: efflux RND transporter periplasmic adaptor subunit [Vicinamibacterales bacterium]|jgi:HlyD family secretion protein|nr:efflux RND transporter periplasmic adaptor subunit [Vicinamibacterales bacterium]
MNRRNVLIALAVVVLGGALIAANLYLQRDTSMAVTVETIKNRDLDSVVSASGKIQPKRLVNIAAETTGRVVDLAVNEGDPIHKGQFLLQIDPRSLKTRVDNSSASLEAAESSLEQLRQSVVTSRVQLDQAQKNMGRLKDLYDRGITTKADLERAETDLRSAESQLREREKQVAAQEARLGQERASVENARYDLSKVRIESPIDGIVTRRNIQEGETAVIGTMNNAGTVLLTLADMSVIQAEVEVDETNIPSVQIGQKAKVVIDALPDQTFTGHVTEIGNSPIQTAAAGGARQATNFKVVVVIDGEIPNVRPGFTCTADITTATRKDVASVPIAAVAVRELVYDVNNQIVKKPRDERRRRSVEPVAAAAELEPGQTRKETEGVFIVRDGKVEFVPIKMGIAGDQYFEVLSGLKAGDQVVTGPYNSVRTMTEGDAVKVDTSNNGRPNR